ESVRPAQGDVLLQDHAEVLDPIRELSQDALATDGELVGDLFHERDEIGRLGDEVRLALEHGDRPDRVAATLDHDSDRALGPLAALALGGTYDALLTQQALGRLLVPAALVERTAAVQDPGAGLLAECLHLLRGDICHVLQSSVLFSVSGVFTSCSVAGS